MPHVVGLKAALSPITNSPSNSLWFRRFMKGMHKPMGDVWIPDRPITIGKVLAAFEILEEDWRQMKEIGDLRGMEKVVLTAVMIIAGFFRRTPWRKKYSHGPWFDPQILGRIN